MSHFAVMVIGEDHEKQLAPFDENIELPRYVAYTKQQLIDKKRKEIEDYKNGTYAKYLKDKDAYRASCSNENHLKYLENEFPEKLKFTDEQLYKEAIKYREPEEIGQDGEVYSTCNPNSKWDWYEVGGRWAGLLKLKEGVTPIAPPNFSWGWPLKEQQKVLLENRADVAFKKDIENIGEIVCFALLKDGKWYERGEMGWWAVVSNEKPEEEFDSEFKKLVSELPDDTLITIVDCHI